MVACVFNKEGNVAADGLDITHSLPIGVFLP